MLSFSALGADNVRDEREFKQKLQKMYFRINKSIELIRDQITSNQSAPFLANLYMELADYLNQKANVMYYLKMENLKGDVGEGEDANKQFSDVVSATKEAIAVYEKIIKEFPKFAGRSRAYYSLAVALKSIDERIAFIRTVSELIKTYKGSEDAVKGQILLGQHQFDNGILDEAYKTFLPVSTTKFAYERNVAKYKMGLIKLAMGKHKEALKLFEEVVVDKELKDDENEKEISLDSRSLKSNIKREALIDSVRAYTEVYTKNAEPVRYYSNIAPSENMFQEVIEKLAFRYISKKKYNEAVSLLRVLSERKSSPEKVLNIYKEVLLMIPLDKRVYIPVPEIRYVLEKYLNFNNYFVLRPDVKKSIYDFFEKQIRDLGTRSHEEGKRTKGRKQRYHLLKAVEFYDLYLAIFRKTDNSVKIATNMGDTYFRLEDYLKCGDYYLRVYKAEFGPPNQKDALIKNAIYCLQKDKQYSFYELRRVNGLLIEALNIYMRFDPSKRKDPKTNFSLAKAHYDQGFYEKGIGMLMSYMRNYPKTKYALDAANLVLDYYNVKSDFNAIVRSADRILSFNLPNAELNNKVKQIRDQAKMRKLQEKVESSATFDGVATGKSYLAHAANIGNSDLRNLALKKALEASRQEKDFNTFFKSARLIASKEKDPDKRYEIEASIAQENLKMTNYNEAFRTYEGLYRGPYPASKKQEAFNQATSLGLALRDWNKLAAVASQKSLFQSLPNEYKQQISELLLSLLESPVDIPGPVTGIVRALPVDNRMLLGLYKAQNRLPGSLKGYTKSKVSQTCSSEQATVCRWSIISSLEKKHSVFVRTLKKASPQISSMEGYATQFASLTEQYTGLEGSEDIQIDMVSSLRQAELYESFANYLKKVASKNKAIAPVLNAKANESISNSKNFVKRCVKTIQTSKIYTPVNSYCMAGRYPPNFDSLITWKRKMSFPRVQNVSPNEYAPDKKNLFASFSVNGVQDLAMKYYRSRKYHYAAAASAYALSMDGKDEAYLNTVLGCSVLELGQYNEALYYLGKGSNAGGIKSRCLSELKGKMR